MTAKELLAAAGLIDAGGCERCGKINAIAPIGHYELARVYKARLCGSCVNNWDLHIWHDPDWSTVEDIEDSIKVECILMMKDGKEQRAYTIKRYRALQREAYFRLREKAETWVALGVPPPPLEKK